MHTEEEGMKNETGSRENFIQPESEMEQYTLNVVRAAATNANLPKYYTVQNGDTLSSISFKMYNSVGYVAELMEANELGEADDIREGDQIVIPPIK